MYFEAPELPEKHPLGRARLLSYSFIALAERALRKPEMVRRDRPALRHEANTECLPRIVLVFLGTSQGSSWDTALPLCLMK